MSTIGHVFCLSTDAITLVNDTVIGDPLYTVPIYVPDANDRALLSSDQTQPKLCYEVHGRANKYYNLVTDECTSVNAHYVAASDELNVIDEIAIRAVDDTGSTCKNIRIELNGCKTFIDDIELTQPMYSMNGIYIRRMVKSISGLGRVRVSVPNCNDQRLVMRIDCQKRELYSSNGTTFTAKMIRYEVMRGLNDGHKDAHGLLGMCYDYLLEYSCDTLRIII